jgi:hypothetical protein
MDKYLSLSIMEPPFMVGLIEIRKFVYFFATAVSCWVGAADAVLKKPFLEIR